MKGKILDFSVPDSQGVISSDDGNRYTFAGKEWRSGTPPQAGGRVDFDTEARTALAIYLDVPASSHPSNEDVSPYNGFYRSSDDKMLAGVCAGLAHKWKIGRAGFRFATFFLTPFTGGIPLFAYIVCWIVFPALPTKSVA